MCPIFGRCVPSIVFRDKCRYTPTGVRIYEEKTYVTYCVTNKSDEKVTAYVMRWTVLPHSSDHPGVGGATFKIAARDVVTLQASQKHDAQQ